MEWMLLPLKHYADFEGRSQRKEFWMFVLGTLIVYALLGAIAGVGFAGGGGMGSGLGILSMGLFAIVGLALIIPSLAVQARRFHDQDKSGWMVLLNLVPYVGGIVVLVFMCLEGTRGDNRYGPDPKAGER